MDRLSRKNLTDEAHSSENPLNIKKEPRNKLLKHKTKNRTSEWTERGNNNLFPWSHIQGQKLFNAVSDPTVCGYPVPVGCYPFEQVAVPVYPLLHTPSIAHAYNSKFDMRSRHKQLNDLVTNHNERETYDYNSLPSRNGLSFVPSDQHRRFSDPGLVNAQDENSVTGSTESLTNQFSEQINILMTENERLKKEIQSTKEDLKSLKTEIGWLLEFKQSYSPGIITEMIMEVRKAAEMRERALFSKAQQLIKESLAAQEMKCFSQHNEDKFVTKQEFDELKNKLVEVVNEKEQLSQKVSVLEKIVNDVITNRDSRQCSRQLQLEQEELLARRQIQETLEAQKQSGHINWLNNRHKFSNGGCSEDKEKTESINSLDTNESLSSGFSRTSLHSPLVTMSGPVTDV